jgi:hypothetical protein
MIVKVVVIWSVIALIVGLGAVAGIRRGERLHKDDILTSLFIAISGKQKWLDRGFVLLYPRQKKK